MRVKCIDLSDQVQAERQKCAAEARSAFDDCLAWLAGPAQRLQLHGVENELLGRLMRLGCALVAYWLALRLPSAVEATRTLGHASYRCRGMRVAVFRTRFGEVQSPRALYERVHGSGPGSFAPQDREVGLAAGRMTLGVHLLAGYLAAKLVFDDVVDVIAQFGGYVPSKRAVLGIVDQLGPEAAALLEDMPVPDDDGEILVIQSDDKGAPMLGSQEHARRCRPRHQPSRSRAERRARRRDRPRPRRTKGKKSKNARMAKAFVIYTLRRTADGKLEGPINKRVIVSFKSRTEAFRLALHEAKKRGYGTKPTYFLADGSRAIWTMQRKFFPLAKACIDWYHVCEYLWAAGGTCFKEGSSELADWVHDRKAELLAGKLDDMLAALRRLTGRIGSSGPGTKGRRERLAKAIRYIEGHRDRMSYAELAKVDMDIATGAVEGAVNHVVGRRVDGSMMRWSPARAGHVVALRCVVVNGLWDHFAATVADSHSRRREVVVGRITPPKPQEPYDAVRKAA